MSTRPAGWVFFTNHFFVLLVLTWEPGSRLREIAAHVGITERMAQLIVRDLAEAGYITVHKEGRRNLYEVNEAAALRHPLLAGTPIKPLLDALAKERLGTGPVGSTET